MTATDTYFTLESYRGILTRAQRLGYRIVPFCDFTSPTPEAPVLLLRHDLDHSIRSAATLAEVEASVGVRSTYFVQVACDFYNLLSSESRALLGRIQDLGHEIGLHYDSTRYQDGGAEVARRDLALLENLTHHPIRSASQHIPIDSPRFNILDVVEREAYEPRFTQGDMTYISDSLMAWRQARPHDLLDARRSFQLLTHPMKWVADFRDMDQALAGSLEEETQWLRQRYNAISATYATLLSERAERDARFRAMRQQQPPRPAQPPTTVTPTQTT